MKAVSRYSFWTLYEDVGRRTVQLGTMYREKGESEKNAIKRAEVLFEKDLEKLRRKK